MTDAERYFEQNTDWAIGLAMRQAKRRRQPYCDEARNAALIGLWDAASKYKPAKGVAFRTYATTRVLGAVQDELRGLCWWPSQERRGRYEGAQKPGRVWRVGLGGEVGHFCVFDVIEDSEHADAQTVAERADLLAQLWAAIPTRKHKIVLYLWVVLGWTQPEIGKIYGVGASRVAQIAHEALACARERAARLLSASVKRSLGDWSL